MLITLKELKPNPFRDFIVDPINEENVEALVASIKQNDFWNGVTCRENAKGEYEIAAGHHRVKAAIKAGIKTADVFVGNFDDAAMIRVYATENATQRGNSTTAVAGSIASAIRFISKALMTGQELAGIPARSEKGLDVARGMMEEGIGARTILQFLPHVPGLTRNTIDTQLSNLKGSGDYHRILKEVAEQVEQENKKALEELAKAEKQAEAIRLEKEAAERREREAEARRKEAAKAAKAAKEEADRKRAEAEAAQAELDRQKEEALAKLAEKRRKEHEAELAKFDAMRKTRDAVTNITEKANSHVKTFDFEGVAAVLDNSHQVETFRQMVTGPNVGIDLLPVDQQAAFAQLLVKKAAQTGQRDGLTAAFIRDWGVHYILEAKHGQRKITREEKEFAERRDAMRYIENKLSSAARKLIAAAYELDEAQAKIKDEGIRKYAVPGELVEAIGIWAKSVRYFERHFQ